MGLGPMAALWRTLASCHAACVHADDLLVEAWKPGLILGDQLRIEGARPIPRNVDRHFRAFRLHHLRRCAVSAVPHAGAMLV